MTQKDRETIERAIGIVEGLSWVSDKNMSEALITVVEMLDSVMLSEEVEHEP